MLSAPSGRARYITRAIGMRRTALPSSQFLMSNLEKAMNKKTIMAALAFSALKLVSTPAQEPPQGPTDEQVIRKSVDEYCAAFNSGDIDALLTFWANDADYVDADGESHRGKEAIGALF